MSHLLSTMRKIAEEESGSLAAAGPQLPPISSGVQFRLRGREFRNGVDVFAAIVTRVHPENDTVDLVVVLDADDFMSQRDVPRETEANKWGWSPVASGNSDAMAALDRFKEELGHVIFGAHQKVEESVYDVLIDFEDRIKAVEAYLEPLKGKTKTKRKARG